MDRIKHDSQGFLVGELLETSKALIAGQQKGLDQLARIERILSRTSPGQRAARYVDMPAVIPELKRASTQAAVSKVAAEALRQVMAGPAASVIVEPDIRRRQQALSQKRGEGGKFAKSEPEAATAGMSGSNVRQLAIALRDTATNATRGADPSIAAAKEFKDVVEPLGRGLSFMAERRKEHRQERWYGKILRALADLGKPKKKGPTDPTVVAGGGAGGGLIAVLTLMFTKLLGLLTRIPFIGGPISAGAGLLGRLGGGILAGGAGLLGRLGGGLGALGKSGGALLGRGLSAGLGLLKRMPVIGTLLTGGLAAGSAMGMSDDPTLSAEENRQNRYRFTGEAAGMGIGALIGGAAGSFLGPFGTAAGAWAGALAGEKLGGAIGDWTRSMIDAKVPERIVAYVSAAWDSLITDLKTAWEAVTTKIGAAADTVMGGFSRFGKIIGAVGDTINTWIEKITGVNPKKVLTESFNFWKDKISEGMDGLQDKLSKAGQWLGDNLVPETIKRAAEAGANAAFAVDGAAKVVDAGPGFTVVKNADGSVVRKTGSRSWRNNNPGNVEYREFAKSMGAIGTDGRFAVFPTLEAGEKARSRLLFSSGKYKNLTLSQAIEDYAPPEENNTALYIATVLKAVGGVNKRMVDYSDSERAAILESMKRHEGFKPGIVTPIKPNTPVVSAHMPSLMTATSIKSIASVIPSLGPAPVVEVAQRLNAPPPQRITVQVDREVGQNVSDRGIAHVVTGGLGGQ